MMHAGELVSKADLTEHIYQQDFDRDSNVLEVFIGRLRKKLDPEGTLKPIETVRGRGYRFATPRSNAGRPRRRASGDRGGAQWIRLPRPWRGIRRAGCHPQPDN